MLRTWQPAFACHLLIARCMRTLIRPASLFSPHVHACCLYSSWYLYHVCREAFFHGPAMHSISWSKNGFNAKVSDTDLAMPAWPKIRGLTPQADASLPRSTTPHRVTTPHKPARHSLDLIFSKTQSTESVAPHNDISLHISVSPGGSTGAELGFNQ